MKEVCTNSALPASSLRALAAAVVLLSASLLSAELPERSQQLLEKFKTFETEETAKLTRLLEEKRTAVIELLSAQATDETSKGNVDGALEIHNTIVSLGGKRGDLSPVNPDPAKAASWQVPGDAFRYKGDYYKVYGTAKPLTWDQARVLCQAVGGEIGWIDREEDIPMLVKLMQPVVEDKGHGPIWMGGEVDKQGKWLWVDGSSVDDGIWSNPSDKIPKGENPVIVRWIGSFQFEGREGRSIGYLCRWKR